MKTEQYYLDRQNEIQKQIDRIKIKLNFYKKWDDKHFNNKFDSLPEFKKEEIRKITFSFPWNYYNDLLADLENKLKDNYCDYQDYHFEKYGWCAY